MTNINDFLMTQDKNVFEETAKKVNKEFKDVNPSDKINYLLNLDPIVADALFFSSSYNYNNELVDELTAMYGRKDKQPRSITESSMRSIMNMYGNELGVTQLLKILCGITFYDQHTFDVSLSMGYDDEGIAYVFNTTPNLVAINTLLGARKNCFTPDGEAIIPEEQASKLK